MKVDKLYDQINKLQETIDCHGKLSKELLQKIDYKFRLDWNYYSNRMEGGTLTKDETRSVMVGNITVDGKPMKDIMEMNGHDEVVRSILSMGKGDLRLSEKRIKDIHRSIIKNDDDSDTDQPIGDWKTRNNEIINYKKEKISFTPPAEVANAIHVLLDKTNADLDAFYANKPKAKHPLQIAADFHIGFVSIHPFFDGNGRSARILMNLILVACGYPPVIIDEIAKKAYYQYLADIQAYGGNPEFFYGQMGQLLLKSQELILDAIAGKAIEDVDDLDKRLEFLKRTAPAEGSIKLTKTDIDVNKFMTEDIQPLINSFFIQFEKLKSMFVSNAVSFSLNEFDPISTASYEELFELVDQLSNNWTNKANELNLMFYHSCIKQAGINDFKFMYNLNAQFEPSGYSVRIGNKTKPILTKLYHQHISENERNTAAKEYLKGALDTIEARLNHLKNDGK